MKLAFILDPLDSLKIAKDTSVAIMREAARRGHQLFVAEQGDLLLRDGRARLQAAPITLQTGPDWDALGDKAEHAPEDFDAVLMRKDPPFDSEYVYSTYLLELAESQGARVLNRPQSIRDWNEKLSVARFPQFAPAFLVTRDETEIRAFLAEHGDIVVKPLDGMGGSGVFRLHATDHNISVILETITHFGRAPSRGAPAESRPGQTHSGHRRKAVAVHAGTYPQGGRNPRQSGGRRHRRGAIPFRARP